MKSPVLFTLRKCIVCLAQLVHALNCCSTVFIWTLFSFIRLIDIVLIVHFITSETAFIVCRVLITIKAGLPYTLFVDEQIARCLAFPWAMIDEACTIFKKRLFLNWIPYLDSLHFNRLFLFTGLIIIYTQLHRLARIRVY